MNCRKVKRLLGRYLDKEIEGRLLKLIESHLEKCAACRGELENLAAIKKMFSDKERVKVREGFLVRLKAKIEAGEETEKIREKEVETAGILARRLIPVPLVIILLLLISLPLFYRRASIDSYIWGSLGGEEIGILSGALKAQDLLNELW
ncbi:MAG: zf-HC2 domain-containing protein [Candidatus Omnitrophica bacterium]|nr:zf-HC2 domain-containing protein [Candidatus Omnitrophota bacterium]